MEVRGAGAREETRLRMRGSWWNKNLRQRGGSRQLDFYGLLYAGTNSGGGGMKGKKMRILWGAGFFTKGGSQKEAPVTFSGKRKSMNG